MPETHFLSALANRKSFYDTILGLPDAETEY